MEPPASMNGTNPHITASSRSSPAPALNRGRFSSRGLRRASFISPVTGERSKRIFTLREASHRSNGPAAHEGTPLLDGWRGRDEQSGRGFSLRNAVSAASYDFYGNACRKHLQSAWEFGRSKTGFGILKCSLAYLLGSLATFVPAISRLIGERQDSKHMVATVTVWFHPARSIGSMHEATILAIIALCYSGAISFVSMAISMLCGENDLLPIGHGIVLVVFLGGGLGFIAWVKQHFGNQLVNVACSLASLGCITVLIKEGAVQAGTFSEDRVIQVLLMVVMGVMTTTAVNVLVLPIFACGQLVQDLEKNTDLLGEMLISITRAFLSGREVDLQDDFYKKLNDDHQSTLSSMDKNLAEAKRELFVLGREKQYEFEARIVDCLTGLAQDLGGLRSAAFAQFNFMHEMEAECSTSGLLSPRGSNSNPPQGLLTSISEAEMEDEGEQTIQSSAATSAATMSPTTATSPERSGNADVYPGLRTPNDLFLAFLEELGPPTRSLVYTLKQILDELPFRQLTGPEASLWKRWQGTDVEVAVNENFHSSLKRAIDLYRDSRKEALNALHESRALNATLSAKHAGRQNSSITRRGSFESAGVRNRTKADHSSSPRAGFPTTFNEESFADVEEVAAVCGHFSFSLLDFAEDILAYLSALDDLQAEMKNPQRSWNWLIPRWRKIDTKAETMERPTRKDTFTEDNEAHDASHGIPTHIQSADDFAYPEESSTQRSWRYRLYRGLRIFRRDDTQFAIKVGLGALLYALPAFIESTRPVFVHWRGEWGLVSYMAVCSMTVGAANTTSINRFIGTFIGACLAVLAWLLANDHGEANPWFLAFFGWLVAVGCFYLILAKNNGPMGRFILLTYNLGALYSYSLSVRDDDHDEDEGGVDPAIWEIMLHRLVAVIVGTLWAIIIVRFIWPISARTKLKHGLSILWLRMGLVWRRDPLALFLLGAPRSIYMDIREEASLHAFLANLFSLRKAAKFEYELRGPFPDAIMGRILERTGRMLDSFHAMNVVIRKNLQYTPGEAAVLRYTRPERFELSARISHLFSVLASSMKLEYPLNDVLPSIDHTRDRLLAKIAEFRRGGDGLDMAIVTEQDYELIYAYVLVTGQLSQDIDAVSQEIELLYGTLNEENLKLQ